MADLIRRTDVQDLIRKTYRAYEKTRTQYHLAGDEDGVERIEHKLVVLQHLSMDVSMLPAENQEAK